MLHNFFSSSFHELLKPIPYYPFVTSASNDSLLYEYPPLPMHSLVHIVTVKWLEQVFLKRSLCIKLEGALTYIQLPIYVAKVHQCVSGFIVNQQIQWFLNVIHCNGASTSAVWLRTNGVLRLK